MRDSSVMLEQHSCGGEFELVSEPGTFLIYGTEVPVDYHFYRCSSCGEELITEDLAAKVQAEAARIYRGRYNYLTGSEIRGIRERLGLTQEQLERALGIGAKSVVRWENEKVLQNRSVDDLLRLIDRDPSALRYLARIHGTDLPEGVDLTDTLVIDGTRLPRQLVAELRVGARREGTDLGTYVTMVLTQHVIESGLARAANREDDSVRALQRKLEYEVRASNDSWKATYHQAMLAGRNETEYVA